MTIGIVPMQKGEKMSDDLISRQAAIAVADSSDYVGLSVEDVKKVTDEVVKGLKQLPSVQSERWEDEQKKIADALSEKMAYMNTCLNERDIILGYLGVKRPSEPHCNSDCRNEKCESYHYVTKKLPLFAQSERWTPVSERLPEEPNIYTVTDSKGDVVRFIFFDNESSREYWRRCAKAWMPLPEPYKEEQE